MPSPASFNPQHPIAAEILASLADPTASLTDIAARHKTTLEQLTLFITRPDIAERLETLHLVSASRARLIASSILNKAIGALTTVLDRTTAQIQADAAAPPDKQPTPELRQRTLETARRAASRLISLANFNPIPLFTRPNVARAYQPVRATPKHQRVSESPASSPERSGACHHLAVPPQGDAASQPTRAAQPRSTTTNPTRPALAPPLSPSPHLPISPPRELPQPRHTRSPAFFAATAGLASSTALLDPPHEHWP